MSQYPIRWSRVLLCFVTALCLAGLAAQVLAVRPSAPSDVTEHLLRHFLTIVLAVIVAVLVARVPRDSWPWLAPYLAAFSLVLLVAVLWIGHEANGAQRWLSMGILGTVQPSELAKPVLIAMLAAFLAPRHRQIHESRVVCGSLLVAAPPIVMIAAQPDLGTALILVGIWLVMLFAAGARLLHLGVIVASGGMLASLLWQTPMIRPYQKDRLTVFLRSDADPAAEAYHITQSVHAIRRGGVTGSRAPHQPSNHVPERDTDFIFTVIAESGGFVASVALLFLYGGLYVAAWLVIRRDGPGFGYLMGMGLLSMWTIHTFVNIGMTMRLCPIVGVPLPFVSRGGTAMLVNLAAAGFFSALEMQHHVGQRRIRSNRSVGTYPPEEP